MPYFVKNELYTIPDSPVNADFNGTFCTGVKCTVVAGYTVPPSGGPLGPSILGKKVPLDRLS